MGLPTARLGRTDMQITRVGFGAWAIGGGGWRYAWGPQPDDQAVAAIRAAVEAGVNWIDTAAVYGLGHSEELVAQALADFPPEDRPYVFTKCGLVWDEANPAAEPRRVGAPDSIRRELDASLSRLRVERIDLYQVHWPAQDGTALSDYWSTLLDLVRVGKVRAVGLSNHDSRQLAAAEALGHVDSLQPPFSAIARRAAADLIPRCRDTGTGVIVYSPMQSGVLTGAFSRERVVALPEDDWRRRAPDFTTRLDANLALVDRLRPVAERKSVGLPALVVAWTLAWPGVTGAIVGARSAQQVQGWLPAATLQLDETDLDEFAASIESTHAGVGPTRPPR